MYNTILEALKELEEETSAQRSLNRRFKRALQKKKVNLENGATVHHLDMNLQDGSNNKLTTEDNVIVINSNVLDANFIHQLIHFCVRHKIHFNDIRQAINPIPIYRAADNENGYDIIDVDEAIDLTTGKIRQ